MENNLVIVGDTLKACHHWLRSNVDPRSYHPRCIHFVYDLDSYYRTRGITNPDITFLQNWIEIPEANHLLDLIKAHLWR